MLYKIQMEKMKWDKLSMRDRAFLIREAVRNGITDIDSIRDLYNQNGERIRLGTPYRTFESGSDYDYFNAAPENIPQEDDGHWGSRNPHTGQLLKSPNHPTYNLLLEGEKQAGYKIQKIGDREYSFPAEHIFGGEENTSNDTSLKDRISQVFVRQGDASTTLRGIFRSMKDNLPYIIGKDSVIYGEYDGTRIPNGRGYIEQNSSGESGSPVDIYLTGKHDPSLYRLTERSPRKSLHKTTSKISKKLPVYEVIGKPDTIKMDPESFMILVNKVQEKNNTTHDVGFFTRKGDSRDASQSVYDAGNYSIDWIMPDENTLVSTPYDVYDFTGIGDRYDKWHQWVKKKVANTIGKNLDQRYHPYVMEGVPRVYKADYSVFSDHKEK